MDDITTTAGGTAPPPEPREETEQAEGVQEWLDAGHWTFDDEGEFAGTVEEAVEEVLQELNPGDPHGPLAIYVADDGTVRALCAEVSSRPATPDEVRVAVTQAKVSALAEAVERLKQLNAYLAE